MLIAARSSQDFACCSRAMPRARSKCASAFAASACGVERPLTRLAPQTYGFVDQPGLGAMMRQQLRLALGDLSEPALEGFGDTGVKRPARLTQQRAVGRVPHQSIVEQIGRMRRHALPEQQTNRNEAVERRS
jgi:hypothetical protein